MTLPLILLLLLQAKAAPGANLKTIELAGKYTIQVPANFVVHPLVSSASAIAFWRDVDNRRTYFNVTAEQYGSNTTVVVDKSKPHFTISGGREVYYGWEVVDNAYECSMNSPCPMHVQAQLRYTTMYKFKFFDKPNNTMVTFRGTYTGPLKEVTGFEGVGKLLRDVIVPSLATIH